MRFQLITAPAAEPVTLAEAKTHLRVEVDAEDDYITALIVAARQHVEQATGRRLITQSWRGYSDVLSGPIELTPNLQAVSEIRYVDSDGDSQILGTGLYDVDTTGIVGSVRIAYDQTWPDSRGDTNGVQVDFTAGYGDAGTDVPEPIRHAMKLIIGNLYENREAVVVGTIAGELPQGVDLLLNYYKVPWL